jgi:tetratricopeptide (TPR) repeat protein
MILRDEAHNLGRSLAPIAACFDEVVVVDTGSSDGTPELAASLGARVEVFVWSDDFAAARNCSLDLARADWLLWLDGDNAIAPKDIAMLRESIPAAGPAMLWAQEKVVPSGERLWQKRCFPRRPEVRFQGRVHEQLVHPPQWPSLPTPAVIEHWGYADGQRNQAKGIYYLSLLEQMLEDNPEDYYALFQAARCHLSLGQLNQAARRLALVAASAPAQRENPELWVHAHGLWSQALARAGRGQEAAQVLDRLLELNPGHGLALYQRGRLAYDQQDWAMAASCLGQALGRGLGAPMVDLDPDKTLFLAEYFLGRSLERLARPAEAARALALALARDPGSLAARTDLARVLASLGRRDEARINLERVLELRPGDRQARALLASMERAA